jgi:hypothetical protein
LTSIVDIAQYRRDIEQPQPAGEDGI